MIIGDRTRSFPTVQILPWDPLDDPTVHSFHSPSAVNFNGNAGGDCSSFLDSFAALRRYLPSGAGAEYEEESDFPATDAYSCDQFRMFEFKVRRCVRVRSHDWTDCPYAHPGEKARRRDPRKFHYSGTACPEFRKAGGCKRGDACEYAHGVFECWLHPARYRTQPCKDGPACPRRVCFFAHAPEELRVLPQRAHDPEYGSPARHSYLMASPTSILTTPPYSPPSGSPPMSPNSPSVSELVASMRSMRVGKVQMSPPSSWAGLAHSGSARGSMLRPGLSAPSGLCPFEMWENRGCEEEPAMERVESGRDLRAKLYARLSKENSLGSGPDLGWVSELV